MSKSGSTDTGLSAKKLLSKEEASKFELDPHLSALVMDEPFYGYIVRTLYKHKTDKIGTAGVTQHDGDMELLWNPQFVASLPTPQVRGLLKHEALHLIYEHCTTRRHDPHLISNWSADFAINSDLPTNELPECGLLPGKAFDQLTPEQETRMGKDRVEAYYRISKKVAVLPLHKSHEWYFTELMSDPEIKKDIEKIQSLGGKSLARAIRDGDVKVDENGNLVDRDGNPVDILPGDGDDHEGWDDMTDADREILKGKVREALEAAVKHADSSSIGWGSVSAELRQKIREMISREVDWKSLLKQFCGTSRRADREQNVKRLNRKYPGIHPGAQIGHTSSVAVYIDQSGSVSDESLALFFGELKGLTKRTQFDVFYFDTEVDEKSKTTWRKGKIPDPKRTRCGGTDFNAPTDHANKHKVEYDAMIILSDGECFKPKPSVRKRAYIICPNSKLAFKPDARDVIIQMKRSKKD